jgi:hypothetical protein
MELILRKMCNDKLYSLFVIGDKLFVPKFDSKNPTLKVQVLVTPLRGYNAFHLKGVRATVFSILILVPIRT